MSRLYLTASSTVAADGTATLAFGNVPLDSVYTGSLCIPAAPPAATFVVTVGGPTPTTGATWGQWNGAAASPLVQAVGNESIVIAAAGLLPGSNVAAVLTGRVDDAEDAEPISPSSTVPLFTQRFIGFQTLAGASGSFTVQGVQPADAYLIFVPTGSTVPIFVDSTSATANGAAAVVVNVPAVANGDMMILSVATAQAVTITTPAGWTLLQNTSNGTASDPRLAMFSRPAASEPASYTVNLGGAARVCAAISAYRGVAGVDASGATNSGAASSASVIASSVNAAATGEFLVGAFAVSSNSTFTPPGSMLERQDVNAGTLVSLEVADELLVAAGATGTRTATASVAGRWAAGLVALTPAAGTSAGDAIMLALRSTDGLITYGFAMVGATTPAGTPLLPVPGPTVTVTWASANASRQRPTGLAIYASPVPLPVFEQGNSQSRVSGSFAVGSYSIISAATATAGRLLRVDVSTSGGPAELRVRVNAASLGGPLSAGGFEVADTVSIAGAVSVLSVETPASIYMGTDPGNHAGDLAWLDVIGGTATNVDILLTWKNLGP